MGDVMSEENIFYTESVLEEKLEPVQFTPVPSQATMYDSSNTKTISVDLIIYGATTICLSEALHNKVVKKIGERPECNCKVTVHSSECDWVKWEKEAFLLVKDICENLVRDL
jgi:hypothetical protein